MDWINNTKMHPAGKTTGPFQRPGLTTRRSPARPCLAVRSYRFSASIVTVIASSRATSVTRGFSPIRRASIGPQPRHTAPPKPKRHRSSHAANTCRSGEHPRRSKPAPGLACDHQHEQADRQPAERDTTRSSLPRRRRRSRTPADVVAETRRCRERADCHKHRHDDERPGSLSREGHT